MHVRRVASKGTGGRAASTEDRAADAARAWGDGSAEAAGDSSAQRGSPSSKAEALTQHAEGVRRIDLLLRSALTQDISPNEDTASRLVLLRNSAEWIQAGRVEVVPLAMTHDSEQRAPAGKIAYFDTRRGLYDAGAGYADDVADNAGIYVSFPITGELDGQTLRIADAAAQGESELANTLIHEIQHLADKGPGGGFDPISPPKNGRRYAAPSWVYASWQSEYRARIIDPVEARRYGDAAEPPGGSMSLTATRNPADPDVVSGALPATESIRTAFLNDQQYRVFADMIRDPSMTSWRDFATGEWQATYGYFAHFFVLDPDFRDMVETWGDPVHSPPAGGNMVNSVRIEVLAQALQTQAGREAILAAAARLDGVDRSFLSDGAASKPFWDLAARALRGQLPLMNALRAVIVGGPSLDAPYEWYTVVRGDTLSGISERLLGDFARYPELHALNREVIGPDPDRIEPDQRLRIPLS